MKKYNGILTLGIFLVPIYLLFNPLPIFAIEITATQFEQDEALLLLEEKFVITPTKTKKKITQAPSIISVITADEIKNMGARNLNDVLYTVPGFGLQMSRGFGRSEFEVRGVGTNNSEKVLVLIDGHKINNPFFGGATTYTTNMPVDNIKRVEVIRGPGSALYGANAFMAVINIITKKAKDVNGAKFTAARGSFDTWRGNILFGNQPADKLKVSGSLDYFDTDGAHLEVHRDALYVGPPPFIIQPGTSMAPGRTDRWVKRYGVDLNFEYGELFLKTNFLDVKHGAFVGVRNALSDETEMKFKQYFAELGFDHAFNKDSSLSAKVYYDQFDTEMLFELYPEGYTVTLPPVVGRTYTYPNGLFTRPSFKNRTVGINLQWEYKPFKDNQLLIGFVHEQITQYNVETRGNFDPQTWGAYLDSNPLFRDMTASRSFNRPADRRVQALYIQDDWEINKYLNLTLGVRRDDYSDFGHAVSPRTGLTIHPTENMDIKLLYGRAFRAPNFEELFNQNNVAVLGNPNLDAEKINTYEAGFEYRLNSFYNFSINYFHMDITNHIVQSGAALPRTFTNTGAVEIDGVETEFKVKYSKDNYGYINYTFQDAKDRSIGGNLPNATKRRGNFGVNFALTKYLNTNLHARYCGKRLRLNTDGRKELPSYTVYDLALILKEFWSTMEVKGSIYNLFDKEYVDPSALTSLPSDEPQPGRNFMLEISYKF